MMRASMSVSWGMRIRIWVALFSLLMASAVVLEAPPASADHFPHCGHTWGGWYAGHEFGWSYGWNYQYGGYNYPVHWHVIAEMRQNWWDGTPNWELVRTSSRDCTQ